MNDIKSLQENWPVIKKKLKYKHPGLSDEDLTYRQGHEDEILKNLETKLGKTRKSLMLEINTMIVET